MTFDGKLVFGGAPPGTPWGTLAAIVRDSLAGEGYEVQIETEASRGRCPRLVNDGTIHFGATQALLARWAFEGRHEYSDQPPRNRLRVLATIMMPVWLGVALRWEIGATGLADIAERRLPVRVFGARGALYQKVLAHHGLTRELIESWGGRFYPSLHNAGSGVQPDWFRAGAVDLIMENIYAAYTPEAACWYDASVLMNLRFLPLEPELMQAIAEEYGGEPGEIPARLFPGVVAPVPSISRPWQLIFGRDDMPDDFAYTVARVLDEQRFRFRLTHIPYSYDERQVARDSGIPLHPGAARYYSERRFA